MKFLSKKKTATSKKSKNISKLNKKDLKVVKGGSATNPFEWPLA